MSEPTTLNKQNFIPKNTLKSAVALLEAGKTEAAIDQFRTMLRNDPQQGGVWLNLGSALRKQGHYEASLVATRRAHELKPDDAGALTNLGNCLLDLDRHDESISVHKKALTLKADDFLVRRNYSVALREAGQFEKALKEFNRLLEMKPNDIGILWERALTYLYLGDFKRGWEAFEIRWKIPGMRARTSKTAKPWDGQDLKGKTILVYEEQGFGDSILCSRYLPLLAKRGARVLVECKKALHPLFATLPGIAQIAELGQIFAGFDYHISMMSLPGVFGTDLKSIPAPAPFSVITAPPPEAAHLLALGGNKLKVGIVWSGSTTFANNRRRAVAAERFLPFAEIPGVQLYSLQKGPCEPELAACGGTELVYELGPHLANFAETASTLKYLDLVIMTDSAVAHLAGAEGVPIWNLLSYRSYWLYGLDRDDSPWYPSMRLFRQDTPGDWDSVFMKAKDELKKLAGQRMLDSRKAA